MAETLTEALRHRIEQQGPVRFDEFMRLALYSIPHGYYRSHVPGPASDYCTSPCLSPWFPRLVCRHLERVWTDLGRPDPFTVMEAGAGSADLAAGALQAAGGSFGRALSWIFVEPLPAVAALQRQRLAGRHQRLGWVPDLEAAGPVTGVVLAHEVLDNFPVRLIEVLEGGLAEISVGWDGSRLTEIVQPLPPPIEPLMQAAALALEPGDRFEVATGLQPWCAAAAAVLEHGQLLVIDYGAPEPGIWINRPAGSVVTYWRGRLGIDPLEDPGNRDITAHVNFSALHRAAAQAGLVPGETVNQRAWLESLGLRKVVTDLREQQAIARRQDRHGDWLGLMAETSKVEMLAAGGGLGDHLVFTARRD